MSSSLLFKIRKNDRHPIINIPVGENKNIKCMIDTGATIPVWCGSMEHLRLLFPDAHDTSRKSLLTGFGGDGKGKQVPVWTIPEFELTDGTERLTYHRLYMLMEPDREFGCDLILSYEMFKSMRYSFDGLSDQDLVLLRIESEKNLLMTGMRTNEDGMLSHFYVFSEEMNNS